MIPFPDISPEIFTITLAGREFSLRWYAMAYLVGLLLGWRIIVALMRRPGLWGGTAPMPPARVEELLTWIVAGVIIGGRLGFVLFYEPALYLAHPAEIVKVWQGGMSFHGGFLGVVIAAWLYARRTRIAPLHLADALAVAAPAGLLLGLVLLLLVRAGGLRRPGLALGVFLTGYGLARFVVEFFRQADAQFVTAANPWGHVLGGPVWGITMGQLLSLPMVAIGLGFVLWALRRR